MNTFTLIKQHSGARFLAVFAAITLLVSAFPAGLPIAQAATTLHGPENQDITMVGGEYVSAVIDASSYENLLFSFDYDSTKLDGTDDSFTYGWRDGSGNHDLGTVDGEVGSTAVEVDSVSVPLPPAAAVADLEVYVFVTASPGNESDQVELTAITVTGDEVEVPPAAAPDGTLNDVENPYDNPQGQIRICHYDKATDSYPNPDQQVNLSSLVDETGHGAHDKDIVPPFWYQFDAGEEIALYPGQNWDATGREIYENDCTNEDQAPPTTTGSLEITDPATDGEILSGSHTFEAEYHDEDDDADAIAWAIREGVDEECSVGDTLAGNVSGFTDPSNFNAPLWSAMVDMSEWANGPYCLAINPEESGDSADYRATRHFVLENKTPEVPEICSESGTVIDYTEPAYQNDGDLVDADRREVSAVEAGVAPYSNFFGQEESAWEVDPLDFFSIGIEGSLVYEFTGQVAVNQPGPDLAIWEITGGPANQQSKETAEVLVSQNGTDYTSVGVITGDGTVDIGPAGFDYVQFVKLVDQSVGVQGTNGDGYDVDAITIIAGSCRDVPPPPAVCTLTLTSDDTNTVVEKGGAFAKVLSFIHDKWTTALTDAEWVWGDDGVVDPTVDETQTFVNQFGWGGDTITNATLTIAADNSYSAELNDDLAGEDLGEFNYTATVDYDVTSLIESGNNELVVAVENFGRANASPTSNPAGLYYELVIEGVGEDCEIPYVPEPEEPEYGPYCGDGEVEGWEQCEPGDNNCTDYCTIANQCQDLRLVQIDLDDTVSESTSFDGQIYLGSATQPIPNSSWFNFDELGDDAVNSIANSVTGLAVERDTVAGELKLAFKGENGSGDLDFVQGSINTKGIDLGAVDESPVPGWPLEDGSGRTFDDVFVVNHSDDTVAMDMRTDTGNDSVSVSVSAGAEYDCPECKAEVEARIVLQDGEEIMKNGEGNLEPQVILGDGSVVPFGEWFKLSEAANPGDSAEWINDPKTVTNYDNPGDLEGLFVSREGNGQVKVALYGYHQPGGDTNYESLRATIEFNDATVLDGATTEIPGNYKLENHPENDGANSNDNFDSYDEADDLTAVDFDFWVDTKADGITITLDDTAIASCEDDTDPRTPVAECLIDGYKYNESGEPLEHWIIGLAKRLSVAWQDEVQYSNPWLVGFDKTDEEGYYCIEEFKYHGDWQNEYPKMDHETQLESSVLPQANYVALPSPEFTKHYYAFEVLPAGWEGLWVDVDESGTTTPSTDSFFDVFVEIDLDETKQVDFYNIREDDDVVFGCTDRDAINYDPEATKDDGSCEYAQLTCEPGKNLLANADFEAPVVAHDSNWNIFSEGTSGLAWLVDWITPDDAPEPASLELHRGVNGWSSSVGAQHAELDGDYQGPEGTSGEPASTKISQRIATIPGAEYRLSWDFSPRPGEGQLENQLNVLVGGAVVATRTADGSGDSNTDWSSDYVLFTATGTETVVSFADNGVSNSRGTLLDNTALHCVTEPESEPEPDPDDDSEPEVTDDERSSNANGTRLRRPTPQPLVAGASTNQCGVYLYDYLKEGADNTPFEVMKLQAFLNGQGYVVPMTGFFGSATDRAVRAFQAEHQVDVLTPWKEAGYVPHDSPTGWVYQLTRWKINNMVCPGSEPLPQLIP